MITVGLSGGIGSGKTYIASLFQELGIAVYNSDIAAKRLMNKNITIKHALVAKFGDTSYLNGELNRSFIADKVFKNKEALKWLNGIVHPVVADDFKTWKSKQQNSPYIIKEAAILIESMAYKECDQIIIVTAPENIRLDRVMKRDKVSQEQIYDRIRNQIPEEERVQYANFVINNDGTKNVLHDIRIIHNKLLTITI